jgi:hypothetical protein
VLDRRSPRPDSSRVAADSVRRRCSCRAKETLEKIRVDVGWQKSPAISPFSAALRKIAHEFFAITVAPVQHPATENRP